MRYYESSQISNFIILNTPQLCCGDEHETDLRLMDVTGIHDRIQVPTKYLEGMANANVKELAIHRRVSRMNYSRRCAEGSAVNAYKKRGLPLAPGMEIGYVVSDAEEWAVDPERDASDFDEAYYRKLLDKAWSEVAYSIGLTP